DAREAAQMPLTHKRERANHVMENDASLDCLARQTDDLIHRWGLSPASPADAPDHPDAPCR
ncbi:MAG: hypothetical protein ACRC33_30640, partial [Gemmataceae bacterium]